MSKPVADFLVLFHASTEEAVNDPVGHSLDAEVAFEDTPDGRDHMREYIDAWGGDFGEHSKIYRGTMTLGEPFHEDL